MNATYAIQAQGLSKQYILGTSSKRHDSLRELLTSGVRSLFSRREEAGGAPHTFWSLDDVSFDIKHGENVGIIGLNGAGKSTLLKVLSRIVQPTRGRGVINGRVGALLEVGTGFHGDLTGRENTYLYGAILGMSKTEVASKFDAIVDFAGIEQFIDTPVKRYSSGMYVRLAFAVAAHLEPEILLLDEVLSVGDLPFQRKCMEFAKSLQDRDATILFVSHNMYSVKTMCDRVIYLQKGRVKFDGPTEQGIEIFEKECHLGSLPWSKAKIEDQPVQVTSMELLNSNGAPTTVFEHGERMTIRLNCAVQSKVSNPNFIIAIMRSDGVACCNFSSEADGISTGTVNGNLQVELRTPPMKLVAETYTVAILVREAGFQGILCAQSGSSFHIRHELFDSHFGVYHEPATWEIRPR